MTVIRVSDPMAYNNEILLGRITKTSGYEGVVTIKLEKNFSEKLPHIESVFLEIEGRPVPFFIEDSEYSGADILKLKFEGLGSDEQAGEFIVCRVYLTSAIQDSNKDEDVVSLDGYRVFIGDNYLLGSVKEVIRNPGQWLLNVRSEENREILIPFHDHFIVSIDDGRKILVMDLPEGLIDLN